ncbi:MAG: DUF1841 family protein [bacterium]
MFGQDKSQLRGFFKQAWQKKQQNLPLEPLEVLIAGIVAQHPEYHAIIEGNDVTNKDFAEGQTNPFLHMGMHITLAEQIQSDRPQGIRPLYQQYCDRHNDPHMAEHEMMECLGLVLWEAQRANRMPDEGSYLECLKKRLGK